MRSVGIGTTVIGAIAALGLVAAIVRQLPEIQRYLKIRSM